MRLKSVILVGAGGHGRSVLSLLAELGMTATAIYDDAPGTWGKTVLGVPVRGPIAELDTRGDTPVVLGLGDNAARKRVAELFPSVTWATVVHPRAYVTASAQIGPGSVVFPFAVVGTEVILGAHVIINCNATVGHDSRLGDYAQAAIGAQVAGGSTVGAGALLAAGCVVCPKVTIGEWAILAAGAVAVRDVPPRSTAYGIPAAVRAPKAAQEEE